MMNCFYCNDEMILDHEIYACFKIEGLFGHAFEIDKDISKNDQEMRFYIDKHYYGDADTVFYSLEFLYSAKAWSNSFFLKDFERLKDIKNPEQLQAFINKLKVFK